MTVIDERVWAYLTAVDLALPGYVRGLFPQFVALARRAVAWRSDPEIAFTVADPRSAIASVHAIADDAWQRYEPSTSSS
jgi:hypothetical protein